MCYLDVSILIEAVFYRGSLHEKINRGGFQMDTIFATEELVTRELLRGAPIHIDFVPVRAGNRQLQINKFSQNIKSIIRKNQPRSFNHEVVIKILLELAKNTLDHSCGIGSLDFHLPSEDEPLWFTYLDTGELFNYEQCRVPGYSRVPVGGNNYGMGLCVIETSAAGSGLQLKICQGSKGTEWSFLKSGLS